MRRADRLDDMASAKSGRLVPALVRTDLERPHATVVLNAERSRLVKPQLHC